MDCNFLDGNNEKKTIYSSKHMNGDTGQICKPMSLSSSPGVYTGQRDKTNSCLKHFSEDKYKKDIDALVCFPLPPGYFSTQKWNHFNKKKKNDKPWIIFKIWKHSLSPSVAKQQSWDLDQHSPLYRKHRETGYLDYQIKFLKMSKRKKK